MVGFPGSSTGKESTSNAGDPGSIPGSGRPPGKGIGYPLQHSWVSLMAQLVKNSPAMQETPVQFLGKEDFIQGDVGTTTLGYCSGVRRFDSTLNTLWETGHL